MTDRGPVRGATATPSALAAVGLSKRYGEQRGVRDVDLTVQAGEICALLGPNGAGKTTTMRLLVGLARPSGGSAWILGQPTHLGAPVLARVGVLIDGPAFVPHLTGRRNLQLLWRAGGHAWPPPALEESLTLAGLGAAIDRKVKAYSMGMRQRLALAQALMGAPEVLVLDEPANGLDPGEVRALRERLAALAREGTAVVISSHLLAEVELLATHTTVMDQGSVVAAGRLGDLLGTGAYEFDVDNPLTARRVLADVDGVRALSERDGGLTVIAPELSAQELTRRLVAEGIGVAGVRATRRLEDVFLSLVEGNGDAAE